jgi:hypothetical protein
MTREGDDPVLDRLVEAARRAEPPPQAVELAEQMVARAVLAARRHPRADGRALALRTLAVAASLALLVGFAWWLFLRPAPPSAPATLQATLPSGDRILAAPGAQFRIETMTGETRRIVLSSGAAVFDVRPLGPLGSFEVATRRARVIVRGTVFAVEAARERTIVRVYEGTVEVMQDDRAERVLADREWSSDAHGSRPLAVGAPLDRDARAAVRARTARTASPSRPDETLATTLLAEAPRPSGATGPTPLTGGDAPVAPPSLVVPLSPTPTVSYPAVPPASPQVVGPPAAASPPATVSAATLAPPPVRVIAVGSPRAAVPDAGLVAPPPAAPPPVVVSPAPSTLDDVRRWLVDGRAEAALAEARNALAAGRDAPGPWRLLEADALRALGRFAEAADAYDRAVPALDEIAAASAGYAAAFLRFRQLGDAAGTLGSLDAAGADREDSPLAERSLALRTRALEQLGRRDEAQTAARRYLDRYPQGGMADWMRALLP